MKHSLYPALTASLLLAACAHVPNAEVAAPMTAPLNRDNPFAQPGTLPYRMPPFDQIRDEHFVPAFEAGMAQQRAEIAAIAGNPQAPTFDNTIVTMERSGQLLDRVSKVFFNLSGANTDETIQKIEVEMAPKLAAHRDSIYLDAALYARIEALYDWRDALGLDAESRRLLERYHTDFVRAGARLSDDGKVRLRALNEELSRLTTQFQQNLLKDSNASAVVVDDAAQLDGLSQDDIAAAVQAAQSRGLPGKWVITLQNTTGQPVLAQLKNRALRERIFRASVSRGANGNEYDNTAVIARIIELRAERAKLLGYPSHAAYVLEDETARTTDTVNQMLGQLAPAAVANAKREAADMQKLIAKEGGHFKLQPWDWAYYAEKVRKARYAYDESQMRPYFELNRVLHDGVFYMAGQLYGLTFKERTDLPVYHPDVRAFEVFNEDGSALGLFLFDPFARESKRGGAWMSSYVDQSGLFGTHAVVANHLNIPKPAGGEPVLLTFDEVNTMFHEFGHALHGLFSNVRYPYFSGTSVPRDFVEYPSQVDEMWAVWPQVLAHYARHYQTGAPMPQALVDKFLATQKFNQGFQTTEYLAAALLDQAWHQIAPGQAPEASGVTAFEAAALKRDGVDLTAAPPRYHSTYFAHIFEGGYSAGYYAYIWSEVLDADSVEWFKEHGGLKRENGDWFRGQLLSKGGSVDAMTLFRNFRGRDPEIGPLLERRGLTMPATTGR